MNVYEKMKHNESLLSHEYVKSLFYFDEVMNCLRWKINKGKRGKIGERAGCFHEEYRCVKIDGKEYKEHRLIFFYLNGFWPNDRLDHKDENKANNHPSNLREADNSQNQSNRGKQKNNTSGYKGVYWYKQNKKWVVQIQKDKKNYHLGYFIDPIEAAKIYDVAAILLFEDFSFLNFAESRELLKDQEYVYRVFGRLYKPRKK
jgi:hypothetical protein